MEWGKGTIYHGFYVYHVIQSGEKQDIFHSYGCYGGRMIQGLGDGALVVYRAIGPRCYTPERSTVLTETGVVPHLPIPFRVLWILDCLKVFTQLPLKYTGCPAEHGTKI